MKSPRPASFLFVAGSLAGLLPATAASAAQTAPPDETPVIQLDEFQVTSERDTTYRATNATEGRLQPARHGRAVRLLKDRLQFIAGARLDQIKGESDNLVTRVRTDVSVPGHWTPRFGVVGRPVEALTFYAVYAGGFIADRTARVVWPDNSPVKPETGTMVEAGVKAEFLEGKLSVIAGAYSVERADGMEFNFPAELARGLGPGKSLTGAENLDAK